MPNSTLRTTLLAILLLSTSIATAADKPKRKLTRWQKSIDRFQAADQANPPAQDGILFVGSSSIGMWKLNKWFPELKPLNRGFGGSEISDSTYYADTLILKHRPRIIVFYAGDNDIARGNTAEQTHQDFVAFQEKILAALPDTKLIYIAIKPSISRWKLAATMHEANQAIEATCKSNDRITYLDIWTPMLGEDGRPLPELFIKDGLHLNDQGYDLWTDLLRPHLTN